jgi:hypothetical protein
MILHYIYEMKKTHFKIIIYLFLIITISCEDISIYDESVIINPQTESNETITTLDLSLAYVSLQDNSFKLKLNLSNNIDTNNVIDFGVVYSTTIENPTLLDLRISSSNLRQSNLIEIVNLESAKNYFIRGYIITNEGVIYSTDNLNIITPTEGAVLIKEIDLSSLQNINSMTYPYGANSSSAWQISTTNCQEAPCITSNQSHGGFIEFNTSIPSSGYLEFWVNSFNPGYNNIIPKVIINGVANNDIEILSTNNSSFYFTKLRVNNIYAGFLNVNIEFVENRNLVTSYIIDEIKFYNN